MNVIHEVVLDLMGREEPEPTGRLAELMADPWLREKLRRDRRLREHGDYLERLAPWIADVEPGLVIDIGPGGGELMEICRELGHDILGIDAATGHGGMGRKYLEASRLLTASRNLPVAYVGLFLAIRTGLDPWRHDESSCHADWIESGGQAALINSRGSLEQVFAQYMEGPPHDEHHTASQMTWRLRDKMTMKAMRGLMDWAAFQLRPGGVFLCHLNGSINTEQAEQELDRRAITAGLLAERVGPRIHRWTKPETSDELEADSIGG